MTSLSDTAFLGRQRREEMSTRVAFLIAGFGISSWASLVPYVKQHLALDDGQLGLLLLCLGVGSIVSMPIAAALATRYGCRRVLSVATGLICLALPLLATMSDIRAVVIALMLFGAGIGCVDCVMNIQAIIVERAGGRPLMSAFHGLYSLGGVLGAAGVSAVLSLGISPLFASSGVAGVILIAFATAFPHFVTGRGESRAPYFAVPRGIVLFMAALCFTLFLVEGAMLDWSAVFMIQVRGVDPSHAGLAYSAFALTMTVCRMVGDAGVRRLGRRNVVVLGGLCGSLALVVIALAPIWWLALVGYSLVGVGCSNVVPVMYSSLSRQTTMTENVAVSAITTMGYLGILLGPSWVGLVAHETSLPVAFLLLAGLMSGVALSGRFLPA